MSQSQAGENGSGNEIADALIQRSHYESTHDESKREVDDYKDLWEGELSTTNHALVRAACCQDALDWFKSWDASKQTEIPEDIVKALTATSGCRCSLCGLKSKVWDCIKATQQFLTRQTVPEPPSDAESPAFDSFLSSSQETVATNTGPNFESLPEDVMNYIAYLKTENAAKDATIAAKDVTIAAKDVTIATRDVKIAVTDAESLARNISVAQKSRNQVLHTFAAYFHNDTGNQGTQASLTTWTVDLERIDIRNPTSPSDVDVVVDEFALKVTETNRKRATLVPTTTKNSRTKQNENTDSDDEEKKCEAISTEELQINFRESSSATSQLPSLCLFYSYLELIFSNVIVPTNPDEFQSSIQNTGDIIHHWKKLLKLRTPDDNLVPTFVPGQKGHEVDGSHPLLIAILFELSDIIQEDVWFTHEQMVVNDKFNKVRKLDLVGNRMAEHVNTAFAFMTIVPIEIKALEQNPGKFTAKLYGGRNQVIGHLARKIHHFFHFWGIGVNRKCRGVIMTLVSIEIVEMELSNVGTEKVKVELRGTRRYSLFDQERTRQLLHVQKLPEEMSFDIVDGLPKGFRLLTEMLLWPAEENGFRCDEEFITYSDDTGVKQLNIDPALYMGDGSFGFVYKVSDDTIVKIPKSFRAVPSLKREARTLQMLHNHVNIPEVMAERNLILTTDLNTRCDSAQIPSLWLRGCVGKAASQLSLKPHEVVKVYECVQAALDHAHDKGYVHLDVRPSNIVVLQRSDDSMLVQLIDWGCAALKTKGKKGFCGSPPFAHDELCLKLKNEAYRKLTWYATDKHDTASLAYTVAVLARPQPGYHVPWHGFHSARVNSTILKGRNKLALKLIGKTSLDSEVKAKLTQEIRDETFIDDLARKEKDALEKKKEKEALEKINQIEVGEAMEM